MNKQYITKSRILTIAGFGGFIMFSIAFVLALKQGWGDFLNAVLPICLMSIPLILFSLWFMLMSILWYVKFDGDYVYYRNSFGITKKYNNDDLVAKVKTSKNATGVVKVCVYKGNKRIVTITNLEINFELVARFKNRV